MKKAMLFSGGYDSTYLLNHLMKNEDEITILSIKSNTLSKGKVLREEKARKRILDYLKAKYYNCAVIETEVEVNFSHVSSHGLGQPLMWLPFMYLLVSEEYEFDFKTISLAFYYSTNKTHPNFEYLNNILTDWHDRGFKTRKDIEL